MNVEMRPEIAERKPLADLAEATSLVLEETLGSAASRITAIWGFRADENGCPKIQLTISDPLAGESSEFAPEELRDREKIRWRFSRFWDGLLGEGIRRHLQTMETIKAED